MPTSHLKKDAPMDFATLWPASSCKSRMAALPPRGDDPLGGGAPQSGGSAGDDRQCMTDFHFKLIVVFTPVETLLSSNQRVVMVFV